ncbi:MULTISPECIES: restriction endonuclease subunit S [Neisseria]|uniref:Restriction endonuclease subunit S n=3 Tax=Neisseria macacae TaxID=496 RepID=A0ABY3YAY1_9NEIS|nr:MULTISPECIES: restriction endonuclease subunit S [Neisseria]UNV86048.1 restriction endonuclease subunit S [Neisseria macacae ATCC 33926]
MTTEQQLPKGWKIERLGDIAITEKGKKPKSQSSEKTDTHCYPYVDIEAFEKGVIKSYTDGVKCVLCDEDDFLMVWDGSRSGLVGKGIKGALGSTLVRISLPDINNLYAYYFLLSKYKEINTRAKGSGTPHVDPDLLWNYAFPIPPNLETQQAIVNKIESLFTEIDEGIGRLKTAAQQIQQYRQSLLKNAFNGELTKEWRSKHADTLPSENELLAQIQTTREQHHAQQLADWQTAVSQWEQNGKEGKKPSKPSSLSSVNILSKDSELPENWLLTEAESICDFITKGTTPPKNELFMKSGEVPFLKVYNLTKNGKLDFTIEPTFVSKETHNNFLNRSKVYPNDILMNIVGPPLGKVSLVPDDYPEWNINQAIVIYRSIFVHSKFLANYLLAEKTIKLMSSQAKTTAGQHNLTLEICRNLPIPVCSLAEQTQIVAILESKLTACDQLAAELAKQLKQAELLKQVVLKAAFSGSLLDK